MVGMLKQLTQEQVTFVKRLGWLDGHSSMQEILSIMDELREMHGLGEVARRAQLLTLSLYDQYALTKAPRSFWGVAIFERSASIDRAIMTMRNRIFEPANVHEEQLRTGRESREGDMPVSMLDPAFQARQLPGEIARIEARFIVLDEEQKALLAQSQKIASDLRERCSRIFRPLQKHISRTRSSIIGRFRIKYTQNLHNLRDKYQHWYRMIQAELAYMHGRICAAALDHESAPPTPESIVKSFEEIDSRLRWPS